MAAARNRRVLARNTRAAARSGMGVESAAGNCVERERCCGRGPLRHGHRYRVHRRTPASCPNHPSLRQGRRLSRSCRLSAENSWLALSRYSLGPSIQRMLGAISCREVGFPDLGEVACRTIFSAATCECSRHGGTAHRLPLFAHHSCWHRGVRRQQRIS